MIVFPIKTVIFTVSKSSKHKQKQAFWRPWKHEKITFCVKPTFFEIVKNDRFPNQKHDFWNFHGCSGQKSGGRGKQPRRQIYNNFHREAFKPSLTIMNGLADLGILTPPLHHFCTTSAPLLHHSCTPKKCMKFHPLQSCTTFAPLLHHFCTTFAPLLHP